MLLSDEELQQPRRLSAIIVGPSGEGKTQCFATWRDYLISIKAPSTGIWMFDIDEGSESLVRVARKGGWAKSPQLRVYQYRRKGGERINKGPLRTYSQEEWNGLMSEFNQLYDMVDPTTGQWKDPPNSPGLVLMDGITAIKDIITDYVITARGKQEGGSGGTGITFDEQGMFKGKMKELINAMKGLPCHVGTTAHVEIREEVSRSGLANSEAHTTGKSFIVPIVFGDLRWMLTSMFDIVLYTEVTEVAGKPNFQWITASTGKIKGPKVRTAQGLPLRIPQDFGTILRAGVIPTTPAQAKQEAATAIKEAPKNTSLV